MKRSVHRRRGILPEPALTAARIAAFQRKVLAPYRRRPRVFPWRATRNPYRILVSEIMLQQTQTARVAGKYPQFIAAFPTLPALARAALPRVLRAWQGLGYNRRALALHRLARQVMMQYHGRLPATETELIALPGIGPATAAAILAYAHNRPVVYCETNIRAVFIHEFFRDRGCVSDAQLLPLIAQCLDRRAPRRWYNALMDYGVRLKERHANPARRSAHYQRQPAFAGSDRQLRGRILRLLLARAGRSRSALTGTLAQPADRVRRVLAALAADGLVQQRAGRYRIAPG